jgi:7,8-dihydropterin-6-yl-methyl-4-(beta-D-ribofuranosyl)aminobenzene 5'-phosphate synthase
MKLREADRVEIIALVDNHIDIFLDSTAKIKRPTLIKNGISTDTPLAEHGLSLLIRVFNAQEKYTILMDAGWSKSAILHNRELFELDFAEIDAVVLSHGHMDHFGGLEEVLKLIPKNTPLILHPGAFSLRGFTLLDGKHINTPTLNKQAIIASGINLVTTTKPSLIAGNMISTTGEILRINDFEKGTLNVWKQTANNIEHDTIADDQGVIINLKNKGLIVISGCAHSGIINMINQAKRISGIDKIYGVFGGLHLCKETPKGIINKTIAELEKLNLEIIVPMHCVGWSALNKIAHAMPKAFVLNSVGTKYILD